MTEQNKDWMREAAEEIVKEFLESLRKNLPNSSLPDKEEFDRGAKYFAAIIAKHAPKFKPYGFIDIGDMRTPFYIREEEK